MFEPFVIILGAPDHLFRHLGSDRFRGDVSKDLLGEGGKGSPPSWNDLGECAWALRFKGKAK